MSGRQEFRVRPKLGHVRKLRDDVRSALEHGGVRKDRVAAFVLIVDELVTNAIEHGTSYRRPGDELVLHLALSVKSVDLELIDPSAPADVFHELTATLDRCRNGPPPLDSERGRGLFLIQDALDDFEIGMLRGGVGLSIRGRLSHR